MAVLSAFGLAVAPVEAANVPVALGWGMDDHGQLGQGTQVVFPTPTPIDQTGALAGKTVVKTVSGGRHVLALTADGKVYAWGDNSSRQLGNNSQVSSSSPMEVMTAPGSDLVGKTVIDIAATQNTSFLITSDFQLWGWGTGALGGVNSSATGLPIRINSGALEGKDVVKIAGGLLHAVALTSDGVVASFSNSNANGQLGNNTTTASTIPVAIVDANNVLVGKTIVDVAAAVNSTLARSSDGLLFAWGGNGSGQLGLGDKGQHLAPSKLNGSLVGKTVTAMAVGNSSGYAIASDNTLHSWGSNGAGALGIGNSFPTESLVPFAVPMTPFAGKTLQSVTGGSLSAAARTTTGEVFTWGFNTQGALGGDFPISRNYPDQVSFAALGSSLTAVSLNADAGNFMSAALSDGRVVIWGHPTVGRAGNSLPFLRGEPIPIPTNALPTAQIWTKLASGQNHSLGVSSLGKVYAWGANTSGQLGIGSAGQPRTTPQAVLSGVSNFNDKVVTAVASGVSHSVVLTQDGLVYAWGGNLNGQVGDGTTSLRASPVIVTTAGTPLVGKTVAKIAAGNNHTLALTTDGVLVAWGANTNGQIGDNSTIARQIPSAVSVSGALAGKTVVSIAAGAAASYALTSDGLVFAWGLNSNGQLGNGTTTQSNVPVPIFTTGVMAGKFINYIAAAESQAYAIASDGTLFGWGSNGSIQLGNNVAAISVPAPIVMALPSGHTHRIPVAVTGTFRHTSVITTDGAVFSSGNGFFGNLGLGADDFAARGVLTHVPGTGKDLGLKVLAASSNGQGQHVVATAEYTTPELAVQHPVGTNLTAGSAAISFGSTAPSTTVQRTIRLTNLGEATLTNLAVSISTPAVGSFSVIGSVPSSLAENQGVTLILQYVASTLGAYSATLQVTSSDPDNPAFDVALSGEVITPVSIQTQPAGQTVNPGTPVTLSVVATGSPTLTYQWSKNGVAINGATFASLSLGLVSEADQANYGVTVTNPAGSVTSETVFVSVNDPIVITTWPQSQTVNPGTPVTLSVVATGTGPLFYTWTKNGELIEEFGPTLNLGQVTQASAGVYEVMVDNVVGVEISPPVILTVNSPVEITTPPSSQTVNPGTIVSFSVVATGTGPFEYVWRKNGTPIDGADGSNLQLGAVSADNQGSYDVIVSNVVGPVTSAAATLSVNAPVTIITPPQSAARSVGESVTFTVAVSGTGPFSYAWRKNGVPIEGADEASLPLNNLQAGPVETYDVIVSNVVGPVTSAAATLTVAGAVPMILTQPQSALVNQGEPVTLQVSAIGQPPLSYQWKFKGKDIRGATAATLSLPAVSLKQAGEYQVVVSSQQSVTSDAVTVGVVAFPGGPRALPAGGKTQFTAVAAGATMAFEWLKDGGPLPADPRITGGSTATLSLRTLDPGTDANPNIHSGDYSCRVSMSGAPTLETAALSLKIFDSQPRLITPVVLQPAAIGLDYSTFIPVESNPQRAPQRFTATGLPRGLKLNAITGEIAGRPLASKPGGFNIKITAVNSRGKAITETTLNVRALPTSAIGTFTAVIAPEAEVNGNLGGQLDLKIQPTGAVSGSVRLGTQRLRFKGLLNASLATESTTASLSIPRKGRADLLLSFTIDDTAESDPLIGQIEDPEALGDGSAAIQGWNNPWTKILKADPFAGAHSLALLPPEAESDNLLLPQGIGFGSFKVGSNGKLRVVGKLADGQGFAVSAFVGAGGQIAMFQLLYPGKVKGSLSGRIDLTSGSPQPSPSGNALDGGLSWNRPPDLSGRSRLYPAGFSLLELEVVGGGYLPPVGDELLLGLTPPNDAAQLSFEAATAVDLPTSPDITVRLLSRGGVRLPLANPTNTTLKTAANTGALSGGFTVLDGGMRRAVKFQGQIVPLSSGSIGVGYFLLPELGAASPLIRSGTVTLGPP